MNKKPILYFFLFIITFIVSFLYFARVPLNYRTALKEGLFFRSAEDELIKEEPRTETCPLNGALRTKTQKNLWEKRRPLAIMIENSVPARPQSGLSSADVVFEAVAEGGITRFLSIFYCQDADFVGPVRSARIYFLDLIAGFGANPLYTHVGGANTPGPADALGEIKKRGWASYNDIDQFSVGFPVFWRDYQRLPGVNTEHTVYTATSKLWDIAQKRGLTNKDEEGDVWDENFSYWSFKDDVPLAKRPEKFTTTFGFWDTQPGFNVRWQYNSQNNDFIRFNAGKSHQDKNTDQQIRAKNIVVVFMDESVADDGYDQGQHLLYETVGGGDMILFIDGRATVGTWQKEDEFSQILFYDENGKEVVFNKGTIWVEILPTGNNVDY